MGTHATNRDNGYRCQSASTVGSRSSHPCPSFLPSRSVRRRAPRTPRRLPDGPGQRSGQRGPVGRQRLRAGGSCATVKWCWRVRRSTRTTTSPRPPMPHHSPERGIQRRGSGGDPQTPQRLFTAATAAAVAGPKPPAHSIRHRRDAAGTRPRLRGGTQRARRSDRVARQHPDRDRARHRRRDRRIESRIRHPRGLSQNRPGAKAATSARGARASTPTRAQCASFAIGRLQPQTYSSSSRGVGWHNTFFRALALRAPPPSRSRIADGRGRR